VITLNVAVNSYSNALMTLLLSVQFVEIKSTVFKKFEQENLFQLLCADIVERFQLILMLVIIATRNLVELGVWSLSPSPTGGVLPKSFTFFPKWTGEIMGPFFIVVGSEMIVDWLKHAYITKFNNARPVLYERFLDVQCKDYYSQERSTHLRGVPPFQANDDIGVHGPKPNQAYRSPRDPARLPLHPCHDPDLPHVPSHPRSLAAPLRVRRPHHHLAQREPLHLGNVRGTSQHRHYPPARTLAL
jgi:hypothetical protein